MEIVSCQRKEIPDLARIMRESVSHVCAADYTAQEIELWVPRRMDMARFSQSLRKGIVWVAKEEGEILGFANMDRDGYLNRLYTKVGYMRQGIGSALLAKIEQEAHAMRLSKVFLTSSITARGFYEKHGYRCVGESNERRSGITLPGFKMEKEL